MEDKPHDQKSRWSSETIDPPQVSGWEVNHVYFDKARTYYYYDTYSIQSATDLLDPEFIFSLKAFYCRKFVNVYLVKCYPLHMSYAMVHDIRKSKSGSD